MGLFDFVGDLFGGGDKEDAQVKAARQAADAQVQAQREAIEEFKAAFGEAVEFIEPFRAPEETAGLGLQRARALTGALGPEAQQQAFDEFQESPGVSFLRERGLEEINRQAAATGGLGGGNRLRALTEFSQGLALQDFQNQLNNLLNVSNVDLGIVQGLGNLRTGLGAATAQAATNIGDAQANRFLLEGQAGAQKADTRAAALSSLFSSSLQSAFGGGGGGGGFPIPFGFGG